MTHEAHGHRPRHRQVTQEEAQIWRSVVRDVAPLTGQVMGATPPPVALVVAAPLPPPPSTVRPVHLPLPPVKHAPVKHVLPSLNHARSPGVDKRTDERMRRGSMVIDGRLDLHGMTQDAAHGALTAFISRAYDGGRRCLLVITGKGREGSGVLRGQVPRWLNDTPVREKVLGFSYAKPEHGGEGALYVLVKRRR